jgi:hypothetical protein
VASRHQGHKQAGQLQAWRPATSCLWIEAPALSSWIDSHSHIRVTALWGQKVKKLTAGRPSPPGPSESLPLLSLLPGLPALPLSSAPAPAGSAADPAPAAARVCPPPLSLSPLLLAAAVSPPCSWVWREAAAGCCPACACWPSPAAACCCCRSCAAGSTLGGTQPPMLRGAPPSPLACRSMASCDVRLRARAAAAAFASAAAAAAMAGLVRCC